jgi:hypothetical protein
MECASSQSVVTKNYSFIDRDNKVQNVSLKMEYLQALGNKQILLGIHDFI